MNRKLLISLFVVLGLIASACGAETTPEPTAAPAATTASETTTATVVSAQSADTTRDSPGVVCGAELQPGFDVVNCEGMSFDVAIPDQCLEGGCGLIVDVHGYGVNGAFAEDHTGMQKIGNAAGYVVAQPNSLRATWDPGTDDDRVRRFLDRFIESLTIDPNRVHMGGFSQGGWMTWRFVCNHSDLIASAAPAGAGASRPYAKPAPGVSCDFDQSTPAGQQVDILYVHGTADKMSSFAAAIKQRDLVIAAWDMTEESVLTEESDYLWTRWTNEEGTTFEFLQHDWSGGRGAGHC